MSSTWASVVPAGTVPLELVDQDQHIEVAPVSSLARISVGSEPVTAEDCGRDCGAASRTRREHLYQDLVFGADLKMN